MSLIYSMLMSVDGYVEDEPNVPQFLDEWKLVSVRSPQLLQTYFASAVDFLCAQRLWDERIERTDDQRARVKPSKALVAVQFGLYKTLSS